MEPLIIHLSLMGSEQSRVRRLLEEPSGFYCRPKAEGRAGCRDRIEMRFFPKAIFKTQIPGTMHWSGQARQERSSQRCPNLPSPARAFTELPFTLRTWRKRWDFNQFGGVSPEQHLSAAFGSPPPLPVCCSPDSSALQADTARGKRQISVLQ